MLFFIASLPCALAVGLGLLYSLANAANLDYICRRHADNNTIPSGGLYCSALWKDVPVDPRGTKSTTQLYYQACMCRNHNWYTDYSYCLMKNTQNSTWITDDEKRRCRDCKTALKSERRSYRRRRPASCHRINSPSFLIIGTLLSSSIRAAYPFVHFPSILPTSRLRSRQVPFAKASCQGHSVNFLRCLCRKRAKFPRRLALVFFFVASSPRSGVHT
ncbi:BZ3500_MvSof-1268-A1-R1_Chr7-3g09674 [Microbotryum saponariae]|uniref:BZ3500_MvSof-1268-A1-R1_Chr7-3g09674 protein n=1 Tax=Microbotryum saponariae TaxID=289078 RepID=A0A2X0N0C0_9BASI|nr:BZ3501_MvSof-1269-A2-R1_Chr7-2g09397 [Microbotryum saponariae]SDA02391.1 BZ3500_MvSof-1268-A1-R1_Chr7-3g09674 [Microbotryum saponariae]